MSGCCFIETGGEIVKVLNSVFNVLLGLIALIFVYALKLFFLATAFIAIWAIGYSSVMLISVMSNGDLGAYMSRLTMTIIFSGAYLQLTTMMGVGMHDIISIVNTVLQLKKKSVADNKNSRMGEKGVFKR